MHITSNKSFMILIAVSAMVLSTIAAIFSVTGISALFSGYGLTVGIMMSALEFAKVVVASFISKFWKRITLPFKIYFSISVFILIFITSAGIFGYLTDAYQQTKGNYTLVASDITTYSKKLELFNTERTRYEKQLTDQNARLDTVYANQSDNNQWTAGNRINAIDKNIESINIKLSAINDSISIYESKKTQRESELTTGDIGPLKYIADVFGSDIDTIVKYLILLLIFVFDPLAILLFITLNRFPSIERGNELTPDINLIVPETTPDSPNIVSKVSGEEKLPIDVDDVATGLPEPETTDLESEHTLDDTKMLNVDNILLDSFTKEELLEMENGLQHKDEVQKHSSNFKHSL